MPATVLDAKNSEIPILLGIVPSDPRLLRYLNNATQRLLDKGRWWQTYKRVNICQTGPCWVQPGEIDSLETLEFMGRNIPIQNGWWEAREDVPPPTFEQTLCLRNRLLDRGTTPVGTQPVSPSKVKLYATNAADVGKKVLWQGLDNNGVIVRNSDGAGGFLNGELITLVGPPLGATSVAKFSVTTGVQKPATADRVIANWVDPVTSVETLAATYQWNDTAPAFRRFTLLKFPGSSTTAPTTTDVCPAPPTCATGSFAATFIAKLAFYPVRVDTDWLMLNIQAISDMCLSLFKKERGLEQEASILEARAISTLRSELRTKTGDRTTVNVDVMGSAQLCKVMDGFI